MAENTKIVWKDKDVLKLVNKASVAALVSGAKIIASQMKANIRPHRLSVPGGYGKKPGYIETIIKPGKNKNGGHILLPWPIIPVEFGAKRGGKRRSKGKSRKKFRTTGSQAVPFARRAVSQKRSSVLKVLKEI